ncbi:sensor histidine kinase [Jiella avicenniae]|uniref:histidine kinase n=1 Tax=Jiella avicenniae TaxID=2907202 RepID=A0A9X1NYT4_9HYPH|nr:histidine kinase dimerization/phosphoacceptor domain -containing protein [Jiella avicenniae]MCE7027200.1 ATP-binding protein [Jiella avicenniae]
MNLAFRRLTHIDLPQKAENYLPVVATQFLFAILCSAVSIGLRFVADLFMPGAGPFALTIPAVLVATLFGRWLCGAITETISSLYAWYFVLPVAGSFEFATSADGPRVFVNMLSGYFVVALAELFRRAVRQALADRDALLLELQHRVKNNFASIASVLRLQISATASGEAKEELKAALGRVESFAQAYEFLYHDSDHTGAVDMRSYLEGLCRALATSFGSARNVDILCDAEAADMPRDRAILIGLLVNEVANNSVKHAFGANGGGQIRVHFRRDDETYRVEVRDDGTGMSGEGRPGSLGMRLIRALTAQANGTVNIDSDEDGTRHEFVFEP